MVQKRKVKVKKARAAKKKASALKRLKVTPIDPGYDFPETAEDLAAWSEGTVTWAIDDLAVIQAVY